MPLKGPLNLKGLCVLRDYRQFVGIFMYFLQQGDVFSRCDKEMKPETETDHDSNYSEAKIVAVSAKYVEILKKIHHKASQGNLVREFRYKMVK